MMDRRPNLGICIQDRHLDSFHSQFRGTLRIHFSHSKIRHLNLIRRKIYQKVFVSTDYQESLHDDSVVQVQRKLLLEIPSKMKCTPFLLKTVPFFIHSKTKHKLLDTWTLEEREEMGREMEKSGLKCLFHKVSLGKLQVSALC